LVRSVAALLSIAFNHSFHKIFSSIKTHQIAVMVCRGEVDSPANGAEIKGVLAMKRVDAVIRPSQLDEVKQRLTGLGVTGMTAFEVRGFGRQKGHTETYRGSEYTVDFLPKIYLSIIVAEDLVDPVVEAILEGARTGVIGDGKIFVTSLDEVIRIRTGERGPGAI
jgi:nitrogen regulatory protein P-II 1